MATAAQRRPSLPHAVAHEACLLTVRGIVAPDMCDHLGHMNVQFYAKCFGDAAFVLMNAIGLGPQAIKLSHRAFVAVRMEIDYVAELRPGAILAGYAAITGLQGRKLTVVHELVNEEAQTLAAKANVLSVCMDLEQRAACDVPDDVRRAVERLTVSL